MEAPSVEDLGPLLGDTASLDEPADDYAEEDGEFQAAAVSAVGTRAKATALKDAILACLREQGLVGGAETAEEEPETDALGDSDEGF
jgi:hypothetical protein